MPDKWYQNWFNSPYYHILYQQHNSSEAEFFIDNLCSVLHPPAGARILDIACGRGRHSVYLSKKGFDVTGTDLSHANIEYAKQWEGDHLHFFEHDMRSLFYINYFNLALNLFTSFGYFDSEKDHVNALTAFRKSLRPDGILVLDYFNSEKVLKNLVLSESKVVDGIDFSLHRRAEKGKIIKTIEFEQNDKKFRFQEEVCAFTLADFERLFALSGFSIIQYFGDYALRPYESSGSDRLIFICRKVHA
ncbi:class I SAM-dependent methyltransferase [Arcticibacter sp. MXS-1]|uniref:class I SAM-dependent methyltransferase n=1 Tax=Arcticibacter sp. MXS-1 TaxID=3341726 RepID=UPI0035A82254